MARFFAALALFLTLSSPAYAQYGPVNQGAVLLQPVTVGDCVKIAGPTLLQDSGGTCGGSSGAVSLTAAAGVLLNPSTITGAGTIGLATIAADNLLANHTGSTAVPTATPIGSCSGASNALTYNTSTHVFGCNTISGTGTVTSIATNNGLTGGTITSSGTIGLAAIAADTLLANSSGTSAVPIATTIGSCSGASNALTYNTSTHVFGCNTITGGSGLTSVGLSMPGIFTVTNSPLTVNGTIAVAANGTSGAIPYFSATTTLASSTAGTAGTPVLWGGAGTAPTAGTKTGNTTVFATATGSFTTNDCISINSSGNLIDSGAGCATPGMVIHVTTTGTTNVTAAMWLANAAISVETSGVTLQLPATTTLNVNGGVFIAGIGNSVTLAGNGTDNICTTSCVTSNLTITSGQGSNITTNGTGNFQASNYAGSSGGVSLTAATGVVLSPSTITGTGTIGLATIAADNLLANHTGSTAAPTATPIGSCSAGSSALTYNTSTHVFGCNSLGSVTSIATNNGLTGGTITSTGTIGLAAIAADNLLANSSGTSAAPVATAIGSCSGASNALTYDTTAHTFGCNTITATVSLTAATGIVLSPSTITGTGTIGLASIAADTLLANSTGSSAAPIATTIGSCSTGSSALTYNTSTHAFGCNSISASGTVNAPPAAGALGYYASSAAAISGITSSSATTTGINLGSTVAPVDVLDIDQAKECLWNTTDHVTNFENLCFNFATNNPTISNTKGGTGTARNLFLTGNSNLVLGSAASNAVIFQIAGTTIGSITGSILSGGNANGSETQLNQAVTDTFPGFIPNKGNIAYGIGGNGSTDVTLIANSVVSERVTTTEVQHVVPEADKTYAVSVPSTGGTVALGTSQETAVINPAGTLATLTVTLQACTTTNDAHINRYVSEQIISALTVGAASGSVVGAPTSLAIGAGNAYICQGSSTTWFRLY